MVWLKHFYLFRNKYSESAFAYFAKVECLTYINLASFLWDIHVCKQNSPRLNAAKRGVPSGAILFADMNFIENLNRNENYS